MASTMSNHEIVRKLSNLTQLDIDLAHAYAQAAEKIEIPDVSNQMNEFRRDHERHIKDLSSLISMFGEKAPEYVPDFKGFIIHAITALRGVNGTRGALEAMRTNAKLANQRYSNSLNENFPADAKATIDHGLKDVQRHLQYIDQVITDRVWEKVHHR